LLVKIPNDHKKSQFYSKNINNPSTRYHLLHKYRKDR